MWPYLEDPRLSFKAVGVLTYILDHPDWTIESLITSHTDGETSVRSAIAELLSLNYLKRERVTDTKGRVQNWKYTLIFQDSKPV